MSARLQHVPPQTIVVSVIPPNTSPTHLLLRRAGAHLERISVVLLHQEHRGARDVRHVSAPGQHAVISALADATKVNVRAAVETEACVVRGDGGAALVPRSVGRMTSVNSGVHVDEFSLEDVIQREERRLLDTTRQTQSR